MIRHVFVAGRYVLCQVFSGFEMKQLPQEGAKASGETEAGVCPEYAKVL